MNRRKMGVVLAFVWGFLLGQFWDAYQLLSRAVPVGSPLEKLYATFNTMREGPITAPYWNAVFWLLVGLTIWYVWRE